LLCGQLGRVPLCRRASFSDPRVPGRDDLVTSLQSLGLFGIFGHTFCAFELSLFGGAGHAQAIGKIGRSHREL